MKKLSKLLLFTALFFAAIMVTFAQPVQVHGDLSVNGNQIVNENGEAVSFAGPSIFWSQWEGGRFYNAGMVNWVVQDWNATIVRAAMGVEDSGGYLSDPTNNENKVRAVVDAAINAGIYVIIDWHSHHADNNTQAAVDFFRRMAQDYGHYDNVIFEIWNEPKDDRSWQNVKDYAAQVIPAIRNTGSDNIIVVGTTHWGQKVKDAANSPITGYSNIAYTLHFYAASHKQWLRDDADYALGKGIALFITEWGTCEYDGNGFIDAAETELWMQWAKNNNISHCNWSICDKPESASAVEPWAASDGGWSDGDLKESGRLVKPYIQNWSPKPCTTVTLPSQIEAENFCSKTGTIKTEPCGEGGLNIGYWEAGNTVTYKVNVTEAGLYDVSYRYATTATGKTLTITAQGNSVSVNLAQTSADATNWQVYENIQTQINLPTGEYDIVLSSETGGLNLNWFQLDDQPCLDFELSEIRITPENPTIIIGESIQLTAKGRSTCQELPINETWSANAPNGLFSGTAEGAFEVWAEVGAIRGTITINVVQEQATLISNSEYPSGVSLMNTDWFSFSDQNVNGSSVVEPIVADGESLPPFADGANGTANSTRITYTLDQGAWEYDPFVGFGFSMSDPEAAFDLNGSAGISFWHKGNACTLMVPLATNTDEDYYQVGVQPHANWTKVTYTWNQLAQSTMWGEDVPWDASQILKFQWQVSGSTGDAGEVLIDQVKIEGLVFETPLDPNPCPNPVLTTIEITPSNATIAFGESIQLIAKGYNQCGDEMDITPIWSQNAPNGLFTGNTEGLATVTATVNDVEGSTNVTVTPPCNDPTVDILTISPVSSVILIGESVQHTVTAIDKCGNPVEPVVTWSANAPNGLFTGTAVETVTVTATADGVTATATVEVKDNTGDTFVDRYGRLQVYDAHVCSETGEQISLGGMSFFWSCWEPNPPYYNAATVDYLVDNFGVSIIRAAAGVAHTPEETGHTTVAAPGGVLDNNYDGTKQQVINLIEAAIARGIYVIVDWHIEGKAAKQSWWVGEAERFFREIAQQYGNYPNIIYEIYNEPAWDGNETWEIKDFCQKMVNEIRKYDSDNLIICGSSTWSQNPQSYSISDNNIAYTFHAYPDGPNGTDHMNAFYKNVPDAMAAGNAVFATEFGAQYGVHTRTDEFVNKLKEWKISGCAWSVNNKVEPWSIFSGAGTSSLTDIGNYYKQLLNDWNKVDPPCTVQNISSRMEAENYCHVTGTIQTEPCGEGGENLGYWESGNYAEYKIFVPVAGDYQITLRYATQSTGKNAIVEGLGGSVTYNLNQTSADPNNWQVYQSITQSVYLPQGEQDLRISSTTGLFNLNWIEFGGCNDNILSRIELTPQTIRLNVGEQVQFTAAGYSSCQEVGISPVWSANAPNGLFIAGTEGTFTVTATDQGVTGSATVIVDDVPPFELLIQAEDYTFAADGIQTEPCSDVGGGLNVGWTEPGRWMAYNGMITIPTTGQYLVEYRVASTRTDAKLRFERDAGTVQYPELTIDVNQGWQGWDTRSQVVTLEAGTFDYGIACVTNGFNINWFKISTYTGGQKSATVAIDETNTINEVKMYPNPAYNTLTVELTDYIIGDIAIFNISGAKVLSHKASSNMLKIDISELEAGMYLVKVGNKTKRLVKK